jgi:hypothetical protein
MKTLMFLFAVGCATNTPSGSEPGLELEPGPPLGHIVAIGHDFAAHNKAMSQVLANAIALAPGEDIAISRYRGSSDPSRLSMVFASELDDLGRPWTELAMPAGATSFAGNVILVEAQTGSAAASYRAGEQLAPAFEELFARGGIAILLEGVGGTSHDFAAGAGLYYQMAAPVEVTDQMASIVDADDPVTRELPSQYRAGATSIAFPGTGGVIETAEGAVVVHFTY